MAPKTPADHDAQARAGGGGGTGSLAARHGIRVLSVSYIQLPLPHSLSDSVNSSVPLAHPPM
jgi:hypothetical protein